MLVEDFDTYQEFTCDTAIYPSGSDGMDYLFLGLVGEVGEISNKLKKIIRGDHKILQPVREDIADECGDVMWYVAQLAKQYNFKLSKMVVNDAYEYDMRIKAEPGNLYKYAMRLSFFAGRFASLYCVRSLNADLKVQHFRSIIQLVGGIIKSVESNMATVLSHNIEKLRKRKETNKIMGSGDKREQEVDLKDEKISKNERKNSTRNPKNTSKTNVRRKGRKNRVANP